MSHENGAGYGEDDLDDTFEQDLHNMIREGAGGIMNPLPGSTEGGGAGGGGGSLNVSQGNNRFTGVDLSSPQKGNPPPSAINVHPNPNLGARLANPRGKLSFNPFPSRF